MKKAIKFHPKNQSSLYRVTSAKKLATILGVTLPELKDLHEHKLDYTEWDEPKRSGKGMRHIENPNQKLKLIQKRLNKRLARIEPPNHLFCPVKGKSFVENAAAHVGAQQIKTIDIRDYFPSTTRSSVRRFWLEEMQCTLDIAELLTDLSCHNGHLPTGSPLSPILSFYAYAHTWQRIADLCKEAGCVMTIYVDDLTISGERISDSLIWNIRMAIRRAGLSHHKEKHFKRGSGEITGLICKDGQVKMPNRTLKKMHELRHAVSGEKDPTTRAKIANQLRSYRVHAKHVDSVNN